MRLSEWVRRNGVRYQTAWQWARDGKMPVPVIKTATGRYLVPEQTNQTRGRTVVYCRVCSADQETDLDRQAGRVVTAATAMGLVVAEVVAEVGSGLNGKRPKLARLGVEYLSAALAATGRRIVEIEESGLIDDLVRDMTEVLTWLCARLYGRGSAARRARVAVDAAGTAV